jgi:hypothetical protein
MIESPSASGYVKISVYASLATFAAIGALLWWTAFPRSPAPPVLHSLACDAPSSTDTAGWVQIAAADQATLSAPATLQQATVKTYVGRHDRIWVTSDNSLFVTVAKTRRSDSHYPLARIMGPIVDDSAGLRRGCPFTSIDGHAGTIETSHFSSDAGRSYLEVFAQIDDHGDSVIRVTITANSEQMQRAGLTMVRSLRFVAPPTN